MCEASPRTGAAAHTARRARAGAACAEQLWRHQRPRLVLSGVRVFAWPADADEADAAERVETSPCGMAWEIGVHWAPSVHSPGDIGTCSRGLPSAVGEAMEVPRLGPADASAYELGIGESSKHSTWPGRVALCDLEGGWVFRGGDSGMACRGALGMRHGAGIVVASEGHPCHKLGHLTLPLMQVSMDASPIFCGALLVVIARANA